ncbi:MAG: quinolinate synthase NadA [Actinobacteria bacterium]|nr:quinolinate synthase NadA [Actinomycetota bacterium]MDI6830694.1 quinolinate synthase NadA [Actinomycetota bacterium]
MNGVDELLVGEDALAEMILRAKEERRAIILAHNYQRPEVQDIADFVGDSLGLARQAASTDAEVIVFCGVHFMAETASILSPEKVVLLPDMEAGCPMADMAGAAQVRKAREEHPGAAVVSYVNTTAAVKAESDCCCTSSNAVEVVRSVEAEEVIFVPDRNLAAYVADRVPEKRIIPWDGFCHVHQGIQAEHVLKALEEHPRAEVIAHPECTREVLALAHHIRSTSGMVDAAAASPAEVFILATEAGMIHPLTKAVPGKRFYPPAREPVCPNMKLTTLTKVLRALETLTPQVRVPEEIRVRALRAVERMLAPA